MSKALPWKLPKDILSGDQRGRKPIEWSPVVANHVLSSIMNDGGSHPHPHPQPDDDQPEQQPLLANAGAASAQQPGQQSLLGANIAGSTSAQQPASAPPPAQMNISGSATRKAQRTPRRRVRKFSTVAEVHAAAAAIATHVVAALNHDQMEVEEQPRHRTRKNLRKKSNDDPEWGKEGGNDQQVKKDKEGMIVGSHVDPVITKDYFVQGFMNLRPRIKGQNNGSTTPGFIDFSLSLSKEEIEEDILAMTGQKPPRRPILKRPHAVQKRIKKLFPGLDLDLVCPQAYAVEEETAGKRI